MADKQVTLVSPDGREYQTADPGELNSLVLASGYQVKGGKSADEAIASLTARTSEKSSAKADDDKSSK